MENRISEVLFLSKMLISAIYHEVNFEKSPENQKLFSRFPYKETFKGVRQDQNLYDQST